MKELSTLSVLCFGMYLVISRRQTPLTCPRFDQARRFMCRGSLRAMLAIIKTLTETQLLNYMFTVSGRNLYTRIGLEATVGTREKESLSF